VILLVLAALVLLAIPLYFLRTPKVEPKKVAPKGPTGFAPSVPAGAEQADEEKRFTLGEVQRVSCSSAQGVRGKTGRLCDELPFFEKALASAIREAIDCAPKTGDGGTLNYVLSIDFSKNKLHVFPGASGMWKGPQARRSTECVKQALSAPEWDKISHNYRYYEIALLTTYKPPAPTSMPLFE
jgi:hypothetical protein